MGIMRALVKTKPAPGLELLDVPRPEAGPGRVVVRVMATSLCGPDVVQYGLTMRPDTKALFISGHPREVLIEQGLSEEMPFLAKPFVFKELEGRIQELLRSSTPEATMRRLCSSACTPDAAAGAPRGRTSKRRRKRRLVRGIRET